MEYFKSSTELQAFLANYPNNSIGLVPTMGALHQGHLSLVKLADQQNDKVVVSIFVNPTQFNNPKDLETYPRTFEKDKSVLWETFPTVYIYHPDIEDLYPNGLVSKTYDLNGLDLVMEGAHRPGHFNGVGTVVEALFNAVKPNKAYFGEKDFQQLKIIQHLTNKYHWGTDIISCPISRESNGLARSSRNELLSKATRSQAGFIYEALKYAKYSFGTKSAMTIRKEVEQRFANTKTFDLEYFEMVDEETLQPIHRKLSNRKYRAFLAVFADGVRLIDNIAL